MTDSVLLTAIVVLLFNMALILWRAMRGPTAYDRLLAVNVFGTHTVLTIALLAFLNDDMAYLDMALLYGLINFIATIALLRYFKYRSFSRDQ